MPYAQTDKSEPDRFLSNPSPDVRTPDKLEGGKRFQPVTELEPASDQPPAIKVLTAGIMSGKSNQLLLGSAGSGTTFNMANVIA